MIRAVMFDKKLSKGLWGKLIHTAFYLKNRLPYVNRVTPYEKVKGEKSSLTHLKVLEAWAWVHVFKKKCTKLKTHSWQEIFIDYKEKNMYRVYDSQTDIVYVSHNIWVDELDIYSCETDYDYADEEWASEDNTLFASEVQDSDSDNEVSTFKQKKTRSVTSEDDSQNSTPC